MNKINITIKIMLSAILILTSSCSISQVRETETISFANVNTSKLQKKTSGDISYSEFIYSPSKWPLEDFISGLSSGRFDEAIRNLDISYRPSNVDNELMLNLIKNGFIPVYVEIQNNGASDVPLSLNEFTLTDGKEKMAPLKRSELPNRVSRFSPGNVAENATTLTGVVVFAALIVAVMAAAGPGNYNLGAGGTDSKWFGRGDGLADQGTLKSSTVITSINYGDALLADKVLKPGETAQGLLFFQTKNQRPPMHPQLQLQQ